MMRMMGVPMAKTDLLQWKGVHLGIDDNEDDAVFASQGEEEE